jgi:two-component system phosphate regulon response regulator OmpR
MNHGLRDPTVLVVDDEPEICLLLAEYLGRHGFTVHTAPDAASARGQVARQVPALAILDIAMPGENGLTLARALREAHPGMGLLMLTTASDMVDRIAGLELGVDDYMPKPFEMRELLARVRAVMRRVNVTLAATAAAAPTQPAAPPGPQCVPFGACRLDLVKRCLLGPDNGDIRISPAEFELLALFARHPNRPLDRDQIMAHAHKREWDAFDRSIDLRIMRLRRKIEQDPNRPKVIQTVRNMGYMFVPAEAGH